MRRFIIEQTESDLTSHSGLALIGMAINRYTELVASVTGAVPLRHGIAHADVLKSYLGLLCIGKSDFEAAGNVREDEFFSEALGIGAVPSPETLRQRLDERAEEFYRRFWRQPSPFWKMCRPLARPYALAMCRSMRT
jgi:hypothetical protein